MFKKFQIVHKKRREKREKWGAGVKERTTHETQHPSSINPQVRRAGEV